MAQHEFETLLYSVEDGIATITLNRPDRMNAFTPRMMLDMIEAFDLTDADDEVKVVIVTGAGERAFCAGADLGSGGNTFDYKDRGDAIREEAKVGDVYRDGGGRVTLRIYDSLKPVIAAVNGAAVGIGVTMQLPMDIRLASTSARFGFVFARRGITPATRCGPQRSPSTPWRPARAPVVTWSGSSSMPCGPKGAKLAMCSTKLPPASEARRRCSR